MSAGCWRRVVDFFGIVNGRSDGFGLRCIIWDLGIDARVAKGIASTRFSRDVWNVEVSQLRIRDRQLC